MLGQFQVILLSPQNLGKELLPQQELQHFIKVLIFLHLKEQI